MNSSPSASSSHFDRVDHLITVAVGLFDWFLPRRPFHYQPPCQLPPKNPLLQSIDFWCSKAITQKGGRWQPKSIVAKCISETSKDVKCNTIRGILWEFWDLFGLFHPLKTIKLISLPNNYLILKIIWYSSCSFDSEIIALIEKFI